MSPDAQRAGATCALVAPPLMGCAHCGARPATIVYELAGDDPLCARCARIIRAESDQEPFDPPHGLVDSPTYGAPRSSARLHRDHGASLLAAEDRCGCGWPTCTGCRHRGD